MTSRARGNGGTDRAPERRTAWGSAQHLVVYKYSPATHPLKTALLAPHPQPLPLEFLSLALCNGCYSARRYYFPAPGCPNEFVLAFLWLSVYLAYRASTPHRRHEPPRPPEQPDAGVPAQAWARRPSPRWWCRQGLCPIPGFKCEKSPFSPDNVQDCFLGLIECFLCFGASSLRVFQVSVTDCMPCVVLQNVAR